MLCDDATDTELEELIALLKLWQEVDGLHDESTQTAQRRRRLVKQGALLDTEHTYEFKPDITSVIICTPFYVSSPCETCFLLL